jgi:hypothetical protein
MYLDTWMIVMLVLSFGACAWFSRGNGFWAGATQTLQMLEQQKMIKIDEEGSIKRWTAYDDKPVKKKRVRTKTF